MLTCPIQSGTSNALHPACTSAPVTSSAPPPPTASFDLSLLFFDQPVPCETLCNLTLKKLLTLRPLHISASFVTPLSADHHSSLSLGRSVRRVPLKLTCPLYMTCPLCTTIASAFRYSSLSLLRFPNGTETIPCHWDRWDARKGTFEAHDGVSSHVDEGGAVASCQVPGATLLCRGTGQLLADWRGCHAIVTTGIADCPSGTKPRAHVFE